MVVALFMMVAIAWVSDGAARADAPPELPAYFTATNADAEKPTWPDATGGAAGVWAAPAGDAKGDVPSALSNADLYARIAHNLYSINYVWVLVAGFLVMFMQAGFMSTHAARRHPATGRMRV